MYKDLMVQACLWSNLFYSMSYPFVHITIMKGISSRLISANEIITCIAIIIINSFWNKYSNKFIHYIKLFMLIETLAYLAIFILMIMSIATPVMYYITDTLIFSLITKNIICGGNKLRSQIYKGEKREQYDNTIPIAASISTLVGSGISFIIPIPINVAYILCWIGIAVDNVFYWIVYNKLPDDFDNPEKSE